MGPSELHFKSYFFIPVKRRWESMTIKNAVNSKILLL